MTGDGLALDQDRHRGVIAMQPLGSQHMGLDQRMQRLQRHRAGTHLVGERRDAEIDALAGVALALPVQRLMLPELLEQDHRQQVRSGKTARRHVERGGWLGDRLAVAAGELLAHRLDHLPLAWDHLQRLGDILAEFRQFRRAAARAGLGCRNDHALAWQMLGEWLARRPLALEGLDGLCADRRRLGRQFILSRRCFQVVKLQLHLIQQPGFAFRPAAVKLPPQLLDLQLQMGNQRFRRGVHRLRASRSGFRPNPRGALCEDHCMGGGNI